MARQNQMKVREALLALAALLAIPAAAAAAQLAADRHTLRYDGEVNIGESGRAGEIERSIKVSSGLSSRCDERERERERPSNSAGCCWTGGRDAEEAERGRL